MKSSDIIKIENLSNTKDVFVIRWRVTYLCNYNCDFCMQRDKENIIEKVKAILEEYQNYEYYRKK